MRDFLNGTQVKSMQVLASVALVLTLSGCFSEKQSSNNETKVIEVGSGEDEQVGKASGEEDAGLRAFKSTVWQYARMNCVACHGAVQSPTFAHVDPVIGRNALLRGEYVSFTNPEASRIAIKASDRRHCSNCNATRETMAALITSWWTQGECEMQKSCGGPADPSPNEIEESKRSFTQSLPLPSGVNVATAIPMIWSLDHLGPDLNGVKFEMRVRLDVPLGGLPSGYEFSQPRLIIPSTIRHGILLSDIAVYINGELGNNTFSSAHATLITPGAILNGGSMVALRESASDVISVGFAQIGKSSALGCISPSRFAATVRPALIGSCVGCHGGGSNNSDTAEATRRLNMTGTDSEVCNRLLQWVNVRVPVQSPLITIPMIGRGGYSTHPVVHSLSSLETFFGGSDGNSWINWIEAESAAGR